MGGSGGCCRLIGTQQQRPGGCNYCNERRVWNDSQGDLTWRGLSRWLIEQVTQGQNSWKQTWELLSLCSLSKLRRLWANTVTKGKNPSCNPAQTSLWTCITRAWDEAGPTGRRPLPLGDSDCGSNPPHPSWKGFQVFERPTLGKEGFLCAE